MLLFPAKRLSEEGWLSLRRTYPVFNCLQGPDSGNRCKLGIDNECLYDLRESGYFQKHVTQVKPNNGGLLSFEHLAMVAQAAGNATKAMVN